MRAQPDPWQPPWHPRSPGAVNGWATRQLPFTGLPEYSSGQPGSASRQSCRISRPPHVTPGCGVPAPREATHHVSVGHVLTPELCRSQASIWGSGTARCHCRHWVTQRGTRGGVGWVCGRPVTKIWAPGGLVFAPASLLAGGQTARSR